MTSRAGIIRSYEASFLLDEARLRKIASVFDEFGRRLERTTTVEFQVNRADNSFYETEDIGGVLDDDNAAGKEIREITIRLLTGEAQLDLHGRDSREVAAKVSFGREQDSPLFGRETRVRFTIVEKGRDWCFLFADELDTQVRRTLTRQIRWFPARLIDIGFAVAVVGLVVIFAGTWLAPTRMTAAQVARLSDGEKLSHILFLIQKQQNIWSPDVGAFFALCVFMPVILMLMALELRPISRFRNWLNQPVFYWGDFVAVHDRNKSRTTNVVWVVVVGFVVSILASFAYAWFSK
ncbi:hypothetical protein [Longimicrobium terrae]|uniref:Uncharacterized protein n=1 Tax=Longimicrobium terrae TaxID=1639882 RepID=A0A841GMF8_9BACT|nr:hypothetical protein [Longimicrobium terrae]MBB4634628.1 hypothetical protein [Longimicrobium terrae]MBB6068482.1 hypothetical protein [Longimicrobium terrae]NNC27673.1 hypothetical protein [Longimicrobium terrae]